MSENSKIEWTDATWNPLRGCARISDGCKNCYAEQVAMRFRGAGQPYEGLVRMTSQGPKWTGEIRLVPEVLGAPFGWAKPRRVFVNSMSDLFHESVPFEFIASVFAVMSVTTRHTYQILTKRPARMVEFFKWVAEGAGCFDDDRISEALPTDIPWKPQHKPTQGGYDNCGPSFPYENVWIGVSVEDQKTADERIPLLMQVPAAVRWISAEPLLGPIDLSKWLDPTGVHCMDVCPDSRYIDADEIETVVSGGEVEPRCPHCGEVGSWTGYDDALDWVVVGGESGRGARPMHPDWARSLRDQCGSAGVSFFFKQNGEWVSVSEVAAPGAHHQFDDGATVRRTGKKLAGRTLDGNTHDEYPEVS